MRKDPLAARLPRIVVLLAAVALGIRATAATYSVSSDRELAASARGIITGTVVTSEARERSDGLIETVTEVLVDERIKGSMAERSTTSIVHWGGHLAGRWMLQPGSPRYVPGERVLLFLDRTTRGEWTTHGLALGSFRFERDSAGNSIVSRGEITGWDVDPRSQSSIAVHQEQNRRAEPFLDYVRAVVRGEGRAAASYFVASDFAALDKGVPSGNAAFTSGSYTLRMDGEPATPIRRFGSDLAVTWRISGTQGGLDFPQAVDFGIEHWNAQSPLIDDERSPTPASGDTIGEDAETRIIAGDPHGEVPGACCAGGGIIASAFVYGPTTSTAPFNGEQFFRITHSDIIVNDGVAVANLTQSRFDTTMAHEIGHTLGLRHADRNNTDDGVCDVPLECCRSGCSAIMKASIGQPYASLQPWDRNAADCLYDAVCAQAPACDAPSIANQPPDRTIVAGETTSLIVVGSGTGPLSYQWFIGKAGDTSQPTGNGSGTLRELSPPVTTFYWARVSGPCSPPANSRTATITVTQPCQAPSIVTQPAALQQVRGGQTARLSVVATGSAPLAYAWFAGEVGDTSVPVSTDGPDFTSVPLFRDTKFWVRVSNGCGSVNSAPALIQVSLGRRRSVR